LSLEVAALERAHQALGQHDADGALRELDRYRALFPNGTLASEQTVLRVQALLARGDVPAAQRLAQPYMAAHPNSPYARRIQELMAHPSAQPN
jgi:outer membrane protein assembly factor BamD (BamD/ComL family)